MYSIQQSLFSLEVFVTMDDQFHFNTSKTTYPLYVDVTNSIDSNSSLVMGSNSSKYIVTVFPDDRLFLPSDPNATQLVSSVIGITTVNATTSQSVDIRFSINQV